MRERIAVLLGFPALLGLVPVVAAHAEDTSSAGPVVLEDVTLRWGLNHESNNRAFAPDTVNHFSAGMVPDPGRGGTTLDREDWRRSAGHVRIEKWDGSAWQPATWPGLRTTSTGEPLGSPTSGTFSNHTFVFGAGTGTVDEAAGTATIAWEGTVSVLYYSGMSFYYLTDPVLDVADGAGILTAEISGYASSQSDPDVWEPVEPSRVTVADLPTVDAGQLDEGLVLQPSYLGVEVTGVDQDRQGEDAGSFPQSFVDAMDRIGTAAFWYSSGGSTDPFKVADPITISIADDMVDGPTPATEPSPTPEAPTLVEPPTTTTASPATGPAPAALPAPAVAPPPAPSAVLSTLPAAAAHLLPAAAPATQVRLTAALAPPPGDRTDPLWWVAAALFLLAGLVLLLPTAAPLLGRKPS